MTIAEQTPLWQYVVTTLVALLAAGGGVVALLGYLRRRRIAVHSRLALASTPMYTATAQGSRLVVRPTPVLQHLRVGGATRPAAALNPTVSVEITNAGEEQIALNEIRLAFSSLEASPEAGASAAGTANVVVQYEPGDEAAARRAEVEGEFGLRAVAVEGDFVTYRVPSVPGVPASRAGAVAEALGSREGIALAFADASGSAHAEWAVTETADILLNERRTYTLPVGRTIAAHDALTVRFALGANAQVEGVATIEALVNSSRREELGVLDLRLEPPPFVRTLPGGDQGEGVVDTDPPGS